MAIETPAVPTRLDAVQALRGFAAAAVAWHHALEVSKGIGYTVPPPDWLVLLGAAGVDIFFVISGFIMVLVCARRDLAASAAPADFLINRIRRIYPLYIACCAVYLAARAGGFLAQTPLSADEILRSILLVPSEERVVGVAWTLSYEMCFYLLFTLGLFTRGLGGAVLVSAAALALIVPGAGLVAGWDSFLANPIMLEFVFGMLVGVAFVRGGLRAPWLGHILVFVAGVAGLTLASALFYSGSTSNLAPSVRFFAWGLPSVLILLFALNVHLPGGVWHRIAVASGDASYATYLFHTFVLVVYAKAFEVVPQLFVASQWVMVPAVTLACLLTGWLVHISVERRL